MGITRIDETTIDDHTFLNDTDKCFFSHTYKSHKKPSQDSTNQLIYNFKISPTKRGTNQWKYKIDAVKKISKILKNSINNQELKKVTLVPIPPSKCKSDPEYDNRMTCALNLAFKKKADIRELLVQKKSKTPSHKSSIRPTISQLHKNLEIDDTLGKELKKNIILVDDVITTGAHFKACEKKIKEHFPGINILGLFIARREIS
jgi:predicted amidophosphoribosyltransferase